MTFRSSLRVSSSACVAIWLLFAISTVQAAIQKVAMVGEPAPGTTNGVVFTYLSSPVLNDSGQIAFWANINTDVTTHYGIWISQANQLELAVREGDQAPGLASGVVFNGIELPLLNDAGQLTFIGGVTGPGITDANDVGIWSTRSGNLALLYRTGNQAPTLSTGVTLGGFSSLTQNNSGGVSFRSVLAGAGVTSTNSKSIWADGASGLALMARAGNQAPGAPNGKVFSSFDQLETQSLSDSGQIATVGFTTGAGPNIYGIWSGSAGSLSPVALTKNQAPGTPMGVTFSSFTSPDMNSAGKVAFDGGLSGPGIMTANNTGVWSANATTTRLVARSGDSFPGAPAGFVFSGFDTPIVNDAGQIAFRAGIVGNGGSDDDSTGIWMERSGNLSLIAQAGDHAVGLAPDSTFTSFSSYELNAEGQIAFSAGVNGSPENALWATDQNGVLHYIAGPSSVLEIAPGDYRTISWASMLTTKTGNADGRPSDFNNQGEIVFTADFTDGSQGIFVSDEVVQSNVLPGDFNEDGVVDMADYVVWRNDLDDGYTQDSYEIWRTHFGAATRLATEANSNGAVPETVTLSSVSWILVGLTMVRAGARS